MIVHRSPERDPEEGRAALPGAGERYVSALRFRFLTRFYDPILRAVLKEERLKTALVSQARLAPGHRVLDLGCGTGTLVLMLKRACPAAEVAGLDADAAILDIARQKAATAGLTVELLRGPVQDPPFASESFDRIVSSLVFHHLDQQAKLQAFHRAWQLLVAGGELHVMDWGRAANLAMRAAFLPVQLLDGFSNTADNVRGRLPDLMCEGGFRSVEETRREMTMLGSISLYRATKPRYPARASIADSRVRTT